MSLRLKVEQLLESIGTQRVIGGPYIRQVLEEALAEPDSGASPQVLVDAPAWGSKTARVTVHGEVFEVSILLVNDDYNRPKLLFRTSMLSLLQSMYLEGALTQVCKDYLSQPVTRTLLAEIHAKVQAWLEGEILGQRLWRDVEGWQYLPDAEWRKSTKNLYCERCGGLVWSPVEHEKYHVPGCKFGDKEQPDV